MSDVSSKHGAFQNETSDAAELEGTSSQRPFQARPSAVVLFFFSAVGCTIGWTAVLSSLVFYTATLGMNSFIILNLCSFGPLFPLTLAQAKWDSHFDQKFNSLRSFSFRGIAGFSITTFTVALVPLASHNVVLLSVLTTLMGTASAALHGTLKQMASFVYPNCGRLSAAVTCGMQASAVFVLIVSLLTGFGSSGSSNHIWVFFLSISFLTALCWACYHVLMSHCRDVSDSMLRRDSSFYSALGEALLEEGEEDSVSSLDIVELDYKSLWRISWPCCVSIIVTVASSMSVASWFNRVQSSDPSNKTLPQVLFFTRLFADLVARPATLLFNPSSGACLLTTSFLRLLFVPFFFIYMCADEKLFPRSDSLIIAGVAAFAFSSGYLVTSSYQLSPSLLTERQQQSTTKQVGLLNVCFSASLLFGLVVSLVLLSSGTP